MTYKPKNKNVGERYIVGIENAKTGKLIYHLTNIDNLDSILEKGLLPRKFVLEKKISFCDVADPNIINKRKGLGLDIYIPFHFHPYSAFDVAVKNNGDAQRMIYICLDRVFAKNNKFLILPRHPLSGEKFELFDYDKGFQEINWEIMTTTGKNDPYAKEVKMAECLTDKKIPATSFNCFYVASECIKNIVEKKLKQYNITEPPPYVNVQSVWFENYTRTF